VLGGKLGKGKPLYGVFLANLVNAGSGKSNFPGLSVKGIILLVYYLAVTGNYNPMRFPVPALSRIFKIINSVELIILYLAVVL